MANKRIERLNSLLKEVISEVVMQEVRNPHIHRLITITHVDVSKDLHNAKVYFSVLGSSDERKNTLHGLQSAAGFIATVAAKKVVMRYFPTLIFKLDISSDKHLQIETLIEKLHGERETRISPEEPCS